MPETDGKTKKREQKHKNALVLCIYEILKEYSDPEHPLRSDAIIDLLAEKYSLGANRNTVGRCLATLRALRFPVSSPEDSRSGVYITERALSSLQLRWVLDSVRGSKFLTEAYANEICETLLNKLESRHFRAPQKNFAPHNIHQEFSYSMEEILSAIKNGRRVTFTYCAMNETRQLCPTGNPITVLPLHIFLANHHYYLIAYSFSAAALRHYRLDRITALSLVDTFFPEDGNIRRKYSQSVERYPIEHPHMYGGTPVTVTLKMPRSLAGAVYDVFGAGAELEPIDETYMFVRVKAAEEGMRFFALQYGPNCEVIRPASLRSQVKADIEKMIETYR